MVPILKNDFDSQSLYFRAQPSGVCVPTQLMIRIPLVQLKFASSTGLKRIPKKRPLEQEGEHNNTPEAKKQKTSTPQSKVGGSCSFYVGVCECECVT